MRRSSMQSIGKKVADSRRDLLQGARYTNLIGEALASQGIAPADPSNWIIQREVKDGGAKYEINFETAYLELKDWFEIEGAPRLVRNPAIGIGAGESIKFKLIELLLCPKSSLHTSKAVYRLISK